MTNNMSQLIKTYDNVLPSDVLEKCIGYARSNINDGLLTRIEQGNWQDKTTLYAGSLNKIDGTLSKKLGDLIITCFETYREEIKQAEFIGRTGLKDFNIKRYIKGDAFSLHCDNASKDTATRAVGILIYLNEDSGTRFPFDNITIDAKAGRVLIFPPYWTHPHEGLPAIKEKLIITSYLHLYKNGMNWENEQY